LLRLSRKALLLLGIYATVLAAVVVPGFLGGAIGIWASILWGGGVLAGLPLYVRRRVVRLQLLQIERRRVLCVGSGIAAAM
jgi:hypothetical protein